MIDTLAIYKQLTAAGIKPKHAEAITQAISLAHSARLDDWAVEEGDEGTSSVPAEVSRRGEPVQGQGR
jgi:hypothetical protein